MTSVLNRLQPLNGNKFFAVLPFLFLLTGPAVSQTTLRDAWKFYSSGDFRQAASVLEKTAGLPGNPDHTLLRLRALNRLGRFDEAAGLFDRFQALKENSPLSQEIFYEGGAALASLNQPGKALRAWLTAIDLNTAATGTLLPLTEGLVLYRLTLDDLFQELAFYPVSDHPALINLLIRKGQREDRLARVTAWLGKKSVSAETISNSIARVSDQTSSRKIKLKVGLLLPLDAASATPGARAEIGRQILKGFMAQTAVSFQESGLALTLVIRDTKGDPDFAETQARSLISEEKPDLVIGPVFSDECEKVKPVALSGKIPFFSPTATDDDLYRNSEWFFGLNPPLESRGRQTAEHLLPLLEKKQKYQVLLIAEEGSDAQVMADAFGKVFEKFKGSDIKKGFYKEGSVDIRRYVPAFSGIKEKEDPEEPTWIDVIYAPVSDAEQAEMIVSQLSYSKLFGTYAGNTPWDNRMLFKKYRNQLTGFFLAEETDRDTLKTGSTGFRNAYLAKFGASPDDLATRGADCVILLTALAGKSSENGLSPLEIKNLPALLALRNRIWFNGTAANQAVSFFRYENGEFVPVGP
ncbi:MAG: ABC transporter substrate-binding protein [Bacteroidetes bacterium]|nr:ABC transporter substrate-binding protein [Bacteroidota bacterium]